MQVIFKYQKLIDIIVNYKETPLNNVDKLDVNDCYRTIFSRTKDISLLYNYFIKNNVYVCWEGILENPNGIRFIESKIKEGIINDNFFENQDYLYALSSNINGVHILEKYVNKLKDWTELSSNINALHILEKNLDKVVWDRLCANVNPKAIEILEKNMDKIDWEVLSANPNALHLIEKNMNKISWNYLSMNPNALHILEREDANVSWFSFHYNDNCFDLLEKNYFYLDIFELVEYHFITKPENANKARAFFEKNAHIIGNKKMFCYIPGLINLCGMNKEQLIDYIKNATSKKIYGLDYYNKLLYNNSPEALDILIHFADKMCDLRELRKICYNDYLFDLDYQAMSIVRTKIIYDELLAKAMHPSRYGKALEYHIANGGGLDDFTF